MLVLPHSSLECFLLKGQKETQKVPPKCISGLWKSNYFLNIRCSCRQG